MLLFFLLAISLAYAADSKFAEFVSRLADKNALQVELASFFEHSPSLDLTLITTWEQSLAIRLLACDLSSVFPKVQEQAKPFEDTITALFSSVANLPAAQATLIYQVDWRLTQAIILDFFHSTKQTVDLITCLWSLRNRLVSQSHLLVHKAFSFVTYPLFNKFLHVPNTSVESWVQRFDFARMETFVVISSSDCLVLVKTVWLLRACMSAVVVPFLEDAAERASLTNDLIVTYDRHESNKRALFHSHRVALLGFWVFASHGSEFLRCPWDKLLLQFMSEFQILFEQLHWDQVSRMPHLCSPFVPSVLLLLVSGEMHKREIPVPASLRLPSLSVSERILTNLELAVQLAAFRSAYVIIVDSMLTDGGPLRSLHDVSFYDTMDLLDLAHELFDDVYDIEPLVTALDVSSAVQEFQKLCDALQLERTGELVKLVSTSGDSFRETLRGFMWHLMTVFWLARAPHPAYQIIEENRFLFNEINRAYSQFTKASSKREQFDSLRSFVEIVHSHACAFLAEPNRSRILPLLLKTLHKLPSARKELGECISFIIQGLRRLAFPIDAKVLADAKLVLAKRSLPTPLDNSVLFSKNLQAWLLHSNPSHVASETVGVAFSHLTSASKALAVRSSVVMPVSMFDAGGSLYERLAGPVTLWPAPRALRNLKLMLSFMHDEYFTPFDRWEMGSFSPMELAEIMLSDDVAFRTQARLMLSMHFPCIDEAIASDGPARRRIFKVLYGVYLPVQELDANSAAWKDFVTAMEGSYQQVLKQRTLPHQDSMNFWTQWASLAKPDFRLWAQCMKASCMHIAGLSPAMKQLGVLHIFTWENRISLHSHLGIPLLKLFHTVPSTLAPCAALRLELGLVRCIANVSRTHLQYFVAKERLSRLLFRMSHTRSTYKVSPNLLSPLLDLGTADHLRVLLPLFSQDLRLVANMEYEAQKDDPTAKSDLIAIEMLECLSNIVTTVSLEKFVDVADLLQGTLFENANPMHIQPLTIIPGIFVAAARHAILIPKLQKLMTIWDDMLNDWILNRKLPMNMAYGRIRLVRCVRDQLLTLPTDMLLLLAEHCPSGCVKLPKHEGFPQISTFVEIMHDIKKVAV